MSGSQEPTPSIAMKVGQPSLGLLPQAPPQTQKARGAEEGGRWLLTKERSLAWSIPERKGEGKKGGREKERQKLFMDRN